jgi:hypothetical protein
MTFSELCRIRRYDDMLRELNSVAGLLDFVWDCLNRHSFVIELGTHEGVSTAVFARMVGKVVTVDKEQRERPLLACAANCTQIVEDSVAYSMSCPYEPDCIYLDTEHTEQQVGMEIDAWLPKIRRGGIIAGHDYHPESPGVIAAVKSRFGKPERVYIDSTWMVHI